MDIEFLRTFILLTEVKSFSKLATELKMSQSTLSHRISQIESDFGNIKLINRTTRKFELTDEGSIFLEYANKIVELYDKSKKILAKYNDKITEDIIISASTLPGSHILPKFIAQFREQYPNANFKIIINNSEQSLKLITKNQVDFAGIGSFMGHTGENFNIIKIGEENLKFICSPNHELIRKNKTISFNELIKFPFISREKGSGTRDIFEHNFLEQDKLDTKLTLDNNDSIISAIYESNYISVLSETIAQKAVNAGLIKFLEIEEYPIITYRDIYFIKPKDKELSFLKKKFWETLIKEL
ncbi:MAG: LysR family transcriptional regulator [Candidatus Lokiarchaeota archaeon]|nr:LysR family transcriptional regulator [Candidatus Lokiarchaeota archaeon]